jgi:ABC-2 type transport system permease protein
MPISNHPLVRNLNPIRSEFASTLDTIAVKGITKQVILSSSPYSQKMQSPGMISLQMVERNLDPNAFKGVPMPVGLLLEGSFPSVFSNRAVPDSVGEKSALPQKSAFTKMIVIGDGDVLKNQISSKDNSPFPLGFDRFTQQQYGNKSLLLNIADYLTDDSGIIELRNKEVKLRLLDKARAREEKTFWQILNIGLPLLLLVVFGFGQHYYRKRKYVM